MIVICHLHAVYNKIIIDETWNMSPILPQGMLLFQTPA